MHDKLIKQLRNNGRCCECPYDKDCNEFDSCLMVLLAADAIEDMGKRIVKLETELQEKDLEKDLWIKDKERIYCCPVCSSDDNYAIAATLVRYHESNVISHTSINTKFCPNCGRKLN